jgi:hypothetical protein
VSTSAGLLEPDWLEWGSHLFCESSRDRSLLLPPPTRDEDGVYDVEPTFQQSAVASRRLLAETPALRAVGSSVEAERDGPLLPVGTQLFWAEHSDRATLPSWAAACGVAKAERDYLGRWRPTESKEYVRVARRIVLQVQGRVALAWKTAGAEDLFDEEQMASDLVNFLVTREVPREMASNLAADLLERGRLLREWSRDTLSAARAPTTPAIEGGGSRPDGAAIAPERRGPADRELEYLVEETRAADWEVEGIPAGTWVVSQKDKKGSRTLHRTGKCWRVPGRHYRRFEVLTDSPLSAPTAGHYSRLCSGCFRGGSGLRPNRARPNARLPAAQRMRRAKPCTPDEFRRVCEGLR